MYGSFLLQAAVFLAAAAIAAPVGRALRVGSVIGYLGAGALIGPYGLGFVYALYQVESILDIAELGVVLLLFLIGLELRPVRLWGMRKTLIGAGAAQLLTTGAILALASLAAGVALGPAVILGLALAMSSTAFVLQVLEEKKELTQRHGRLAFSILLFQDLAAIPLLALVPLLAAKTTVDASGIGWAGLRSFAIIVAVFILGRWVLNRLYRLVALSAVREAMTASALLTVVGVALLMQFAGLSAALGAFLAGALLADSEFRHQIEADIAPFEGLLLGLFFMAIGMSLNLALIGREPLLVFGLAFGLLVLKGAVLYGVGRSQGLEPRSSRRLGLAVSQAGEFAFVVLTLAVGSRLISRESADLLSVVATLSMIATPFLLMMDDMLSTAQRPAEPGYDKLPDEDGHIVIAGFGRVGQIVGRVLRAKRIPFIALDISPDQIEVVRKFGNEVYYGDAARLDILEAARTGRARAFVLAIDDVDASLKTAEVVRRHFPHVPIYARARNRQHAYRLMDLGVTKLRRETLLSSLQLTKDVLHGIGLPEAEANRIVDTFAAHDRRRLYDDYRHANDTEKLRARALQQAAELERLLAEDIGPVVESPPASPRKSAATRI
jgi:glutathione-regulated potassium-efflux system protein KefB